MSKVLENAKEVIVSWKKVGTHRIVYTDRAWGKQNLRSTIFRQAHAAEEYIQNT